jgi:phosphoketolase
MEDWLMTTMDAVVTGHLSPELARRMNAYWRAANYLSVGQPRVRGRVRQSGPDAGNQLRR